VASKKRKSSRQKAAERTDADYLASAKKLSKLVPSLKRFSSRKTLNAPFKPPKPGAKPRTQKQIAKANRRIIRRREKQLKNIPDLVFVPTNKVKRFRKKLFLPGIQAIQLRGLSPTASVKFKASGDIEVIETSDVGKQRWIYWGLDRDTVRSKRMMRAAGADAFNKKFPIEKVSDLTELAFKKYTIQQVHLWAHAGIVGDPFYDIGVFIRWVNEKWNAGRYMGTQERQSGAIYSNPSDPGKWVNGIAILVEDSEYTAKRKALKNAQAQTSKRLV
jgi:hypothetical protein